MPGIIQPSAQRVFQEILSDPTVKAGLSPASFAALQAAQQRYANSKDLFGPAVSADKDPALQAAFAEMKQKGLRSSWLDKWGPVLGLALTAGPAALTAAIPAAAATAGGTAAGRVGASKVGKSIWDIISGVASPAAGIAATVLNNNANKTAAQIAADAARSSQLISDKATQQALGVQTQEYNTSRADTAPYRQAGAGAVNQLSYLAGVPGYTSPSSGNTIATPDKPITVPDIQAGGTAPTVGTPQAPATALSSLGQPQASMVKVKAPNGQLGTIPQARLQEAMAAGFQQVNA